MTADGDRVLDLLVEWEERRQGGVVLTPEQLCPDDPDLRTALAERIRQRLRLQAALELPTVSEDEAGPPTAAAPDVAGYEVVGVLGHGGMGVVYQARQAALGRAVALKVLRSADALPRELARFQAEAHATAAMRHPNIVQIFEVGRTREGRPYLALEYVPGGSLAAALDGTPLPPARAAALALALARAVQHAHEQGIVHRDLKPANVLLAADGTPKVADFGLAKTLADQQGYTQTGAVIGTPSYMAPEQAAGDKDIGPATDVWALGAILYELLTGRPPFRAATLLETLDQVRYLDPVGPRQLLPGVPRDLETVCLKCLEKEPARRYSSAGDLADDLQRFLDGEPVAAQPPSMFGQIARTVGHVSPEARVRSWSQMILICAPVPLLIQLTVFALARHRPDYAVLAIAAALAGLLAAVGSILGRNRESLAHLSARVRRQSLSTILALTVGLFCVPLVFAINGRPASDPVYLLVFALWLITDAVGDICMGSIAGLHYVFAAVKLAAAVVAARWPAVGPLVVGGTISACQAWQGLYIRFHAPEMSLSGDTSLIPPSGSR